MKTPKGWRFKARTVITGQEQKANLTVEDVTVIRRLAGTDLGLFDDVYVAGTDGVKRFRTSGVALGLSADGVTGRALLKNDGGITRTCYVRTQQGGWRFKSRMYVAADAPPRMRHARSPDRSTGPRAPGKRAARDGNSLRVLLWRKQMLRLTRVMLFVTGFMALVPALAHAQASITGVVRDPSGRCAARRHGRGVEPGPDREGSFGRHRWQRSVPHHRPAARHLRGDVHA